MLKLLVLAALFGAALFGDDATPIGGDDIALPLGIGHILIRHVHVDGLDLLIQIRNATSYPLKALRLQFDIGGFCNNQPRQWTVPFTTSLNASECTDTAVNIDGNADECTAEIIQASLIFAEVVAEDSTTRIDGLTGKGIDLKKQLERIKASRDAEAAARARKAAADTARRKRLAVEQKTKDAERDARIAQYKAEKDAKAAEERRKIRAACSAIYQTTADTKLKDLTVKEEQQVRACQALGLYPPQ